MASLVLRAFIVVSIFLLGFTLSAHGLVMGLLSLNRLLGIVYYSPHMLAGGLLICLSFAITIALRHADSTVGSFFEERTRHRS